MHFTEDRYTKAYDLLAKLRQEEFGERQDGHRKYTVGPRWFTDHREAFSLMVSELAGYYEAREGTPYHCIVIGHDYGEAIVVQVQNHRTKERALVYAIVLAVIAIERGQRQRTIDKFAAPAVYQQQVLRAGATPRHDWLAWLNKRVDTETVYRGVYPEQVEAGLRAMSLRVLSPSDVPGMEWDERLAECRVREDGAIVHPRDDEMELGSLDDAGGITWILLPEPPAPEV